MTDRANDAELVERAERGERSAFDQLVDRHYAVAVSAAFSIVADVDVAKDCAQEAFLEAVRRLNTLRDRTKFSQWIYGIARQQAIYVLRRKKLHVEAVRVKTDESKRMIPVSSPQEQMGKQERLTSIRQALSEVPEIYREVIVLKYLDGRSHEAIAKLLNISPAAVDKRLMRGKDMLRASLKRWTVE